MNRIKTLKLINILLMITFLVQALSGIGHEVIEHELFEKIHPAGGLLLILLVIIHFILN